MLEEPGNRPASIETFRAGTLEPRCCNTSSSMGHFWGLPWVTSPLCALVSSSVKWGFVVVYSLSPVWLFCDPMDSSPSGSSVHGIFWARVLEWIAISFSKGSSQPRDQTQVSRIVDRCFTVWATREVVLHNRYSIFCKGSWYTCFHNDMSSLFSN